METLGLPIFFGYDLIGDEVSRVIDGAAEAVFCTFWTRKPPVPRVSIGRVATAQEDSHYAEGAPRD